MFDKIKNNESINRTFEGHKVDTFDDLKKIAQEQKSKELASLKAQLQKFESIEDENLGFLEEQLDVQEQDLYSIMNNLENDGKKVDSMQKILIYLERRQQKQEENQRIDAGKAVDEDGTPPHWLKDGNDPSLTKLTQMMA